MDVVVRGGVCGTGGAEIGLEFSEGDVLQEE